MSIYIYISTYIHMYVCVSVHVSDVHTAYSISISQVSRS